MNRKQTTVALALVILLQTAVLLGEYFGAVYPLWKGTEVRLTTLPVDPRSLFRGNYARLRYTISELPLSAFGDSASLRTGERVYIRLVTDSEGVHQLESASLARPKEGLFMRGRVTERRGTTPAKIRVRYGIEAWFASKEKAVQLERDLRGGAIAIIKVSDSGRAALQRVETSN